jgi:hypothetical protein
MFHSSLRDHVIHPVCSPIIGSRDWLKQGQQHFSLEMRLDYVNDREQIQQQCLFRADEKCLYVLELLLNSFSYKLAPQLTIWRRLNPNRNGALPTGMRVLASNCGDTYVDLIIAIRSELGFDVNVVHSLQIQ